MPNHKKVALAISVAGLAALYVANKPDPILPLSPPVPPSATLEQVLPKNKMRQDSAYREAWRRTLERAVESHEEPEPASDPQDNQPDLYATFKKDLEYVCKRDVRSLHHSYKPENRRKEDFYVVNGGDSLTLRRVDHPEFPTVTDQGILTIKLLDDGSYSLESAHTFLDDQGARQPYLAMNGTIGDVKKLLGAFVEWQNVIDEYSQETARLAKGPPATIEQSIHRYRQQINALQEIASQHDIPIDPYAWIVMEDNLRTVQSIGWQSKEL